jgi:hypothetical protein
LLVFQLLFERLSAFKNNRYDSLRDHNDELKKEINKALLEKS